MSEPERHRLPDLRDGLTKKGVLGEYEFYVTVNFYPDAEVMDAAPRPGEIFVVLVGSSVSDTVLFLDAWTTQASVSLQYGILWSGIKAKALRLRAGATVAEALMRAVIDAADAVIQAKHNLYTGEQFDSPRRGGIMPDEEDELRKKLTAAHLWITVEDGLAMVVCRRPVDKVPRAVVSLPVGTERELVVFLLEHPDVLQSVLEWRERTPGKE